MAAEKRVGKNPSYWQSGRMLLVWMIISWPESFDSSRLTEASSGATGRYPSGGRSNAANGMTGKREVTEAQVGCRSSGIWTALAANAVFKDLGRSWTTRFVFRNKCTSKVGWRTASACARRSVLRLEYDLPYADGRPFAGTLSLKYTSGKLLKE